MNWEIILQFFGSVAAVSGLFAYLGKKSIESYLAGKLESHKKNLERIATEHSIRFQNLHSERANTIKDFYTKLVTLDESLISTLGRFQAVQDKNLNEKVIDLGSNFNDLRDYFLPKRIFFEESTCIVIDKILESARGVFYEITTHEVDPNAPLYNYSPDLLKERHEFWENAREIHEKEISTLKRTLENEFRVILGIAA